MRKIFIVLALVGCFAALVPSASAQRRCYTNNWGRVTCVRNRHSDRYERRSDNWHSRGYQRSWRNHRNVHERDEQH
jgi:hypothetical protein